MTESQDNTGREVAMLRNFAVAYGLRATDVQQFGLRRRARKPHAQYLDERACPEWIDLGGES